MNEGLKTKKNGQNKIRHRGAKGSLFSSISYGRSGSNLLGALKKFIQYEIVKQ